MTENNYAVSKRNGKDRTLLAENLTFGEAYGMMLKLRHFMNSLIKAKHVTEKRRTYYFIGRP